MTQGLLINDGVKEMSLYGRLPEIRVERLGSEGSPVVIVENFAPDPDALAALAETLTFEKMGEFYPGMRARVPPSYFASTAGLTAAVIRKVFKSRDSARVDRALYSIATTPSADLTLAQRIPHIDSVDDGAIAIVHYLTRHDFGGAAPPDCAIQPGGDLSEQSAPLRDFAEWRVIAGRPARRPADNRIIPDGPVMHRIAERRPK